MVNVVNKYKHSPTPNDIYIGRGSALGNPFTSIQTKQTKAKFVCESREESVSSFKKYIERKVAEKDVEICKALNNIYYLAKHEKEVNLVCFCKPKACHGDIIKSLVESKL